MENNSTTDVLQYQLALTLLPGVGDISYRVLATLQQKILSVIVVAQKLFSKKNNRHYLKYRK